MVGPTGRIFPLWPYIWPVRKVSVSINSILFNVANNVQKPILLDVGKTNNYENLATLLSTEDSSASSAVSDKVDFALDKVAGKIITELASITADTIGDYPDLADDYVVAIIDGAEGREVRVYSRDEIVEASGGTEEEKAALKEQLAKQPLMAYSSAEGLPESSDSEASKTLAARIEQFLKTNEKLLNMLDSYSFNPFQSLMAS
jgi:hypothetical protein